ncbi:MAG: hypothetical protein IPM77_17470 [Crocinitomicaceae bacterium]|nr:hypothetical protein [Crocinitomicaceae bacterium]
MDKILPVLKPKAEFNKQNERGMFIDKLMEFDESPFVMYGTDMGQMVAYSQSSSVEENLKTKNQALSNLMKLDVNLNFENMQGMKVAFAQHEYAAEKILDIEFLKFISNKLNSKEIVIGIPVKGFFAAVSKDSNLLKFGAVIKKQFHNPQQTYGISEFLFVAEDGILTNAAQGIESTNSEVKKPWWKIW